MAYIEDVYSVSKLIAAIDEAIQIIDTAIPAVTEAFEKFRLEKLNNLNDRITEISQKIPDLSDGEKTSFVNEKFWGSIYGEYIKTHFASDMEILYGLHAKSCQSGDMEFAFKLKMQDIDHFLEQMTKIFCGDMSVDMDPTILNGLLDYSSVITKLYQKAIFVRLRGLHPEYERLIEKIGKYEAQTINAQKIYREISEIYVDAKKSFEAHKYEHEKLMSEVKTMIYRIKNDIEKLYGEKKWGDFDVGMIDKISAIDIYEFPGEVAIKVFESIFGSDSIKIPRLPNDSNLAFFAVKGDPDYAKLVKRLLVDYLTEKDKIRS